MGVVRARVSALADIMGVGQESLLMDGRRRGLSLGECLGGAGLSVDDLRYAVNSCPPSESAANEIMTEERRDCCGVRMVSFFAGAGGLDVGFEQAGFSHVALFEHNELFCRTMRKNRPHWAVVGPPSDSGDVSNFDEVIGILETKFGLRRKFEGLFAGGPPCQPFSVAANQRFKKSGENFKRVGYASSDNGMLLFDFGRVILHFMPRVFLVENVPGLHDVDNGGQLRIFCDNMTRGGYRVGSPVRLCAEKFGVPQFRERVFIVGTRARGEWTPPAPLASFVSCGSVLTGDVARCENHQTRDHKIESVLRYRVLDFGKRDHLGRVDRLHPHRPSKTVIAGGMRGGGRSHLHPWIPRTLSVRESARLQTFPDNYVFTGPIARQFTQVGNAVPPLLARQLAESVYRGCF